MASMSGWLNESDHAADGQSSADRANGLNPQHGHNDEKGPPHEDGVSLGPGLGTDMVSGQLLRAELTAGSHLQITDREQPFQVVLRCFRSAMAIQYAIRTDRILAKDDRTGDLFGNREKTDNGGIVPIQHRACASGHSISRDARSRGSPAISPLMDRYR